MENTTVTEGNRAIFTVKLGGIPEPSVEFFRDGELIEEGGRHQFLYSEDGTCALVLNRVTSADEDQYECTISNSLGEATCVAELIVEGADGKRKTRGDGRRKKLEPSEGPLMPTGPLRVTVLTHDSIEVDWQPPVLKKGAEPSHYVIEYRNLTLNEEPKFLKLKADQTYTVFEDLIENHKYFVGVAAENVYGVSDPLEVVVVIGQIGQREPDASFTKPLEDLEVVRGQDAKFSCEVDKLSGAIKWLQDGVPIKPSSKFEMSTDEEKKTITLVIKEADFDDEAVYTCMCGRKQCVADLLVNEPPPSFTKELEDKEVMESNPVTFECIVDQDNLKNVKWLKDGRRIQTGERIRTKIDRNKLTLTIKEACLDDQGTYTCKLEGNKSAAKLSVKSEPGFSSQLRDVEVMEKESIELVCEVAHKDMEVKWLKNQRPLRPGGRIEVSEDGCRRKLFIREASLDDNGTYFCQTGNKQTACIVNVEEAPAAEFIRKLEDVSCGEHDTVTLSCEVSFDDADVTWLKDGKPIRESGEKYEIVKNGTLRKLVINDVVREDKGRYVCQAGDNRTKADVTVEIPPRVFVDKRFEEVTVSADELLSLELGYEGYPPCTVTWILEEQEITETRRIRVVTSEKKSQLVVKPVQGKDAGNYKCIVENEHGQETVPFRVNVIDKPGPPQDLKVTEVTHDSITLTWDEPKDSGGDEIKGYLIERRDTKRQSFQVAGRTQDTTFTITDLIEGNKYKCRVTAENRQGQGEPAETMGAIEVKDQFTEPTAPKGKPIVSNITPDSCKVTWEPPEDNGGSPITGYVLEKKTSFSPRWNKVTREPIKEPTFTIDGLIEDQEYEFRVAAVNKAGAGPPGPASDVIVARECNEPPKALLGKNLKNGMNVKVGDDLKITVPFSGMPPPEVSWTCGDTLLVNDDRVKIETIGDTAVLTVKDAQKEDTGSYGIKLGNEFGEDSASIPVNVIDKPAAPTDIKVVDISADKATLEWGAPDDAGGADIIDYVVEVMEEDEEIWRKVTKTKTTHTVVEKLKEGNKYKFRVHSENDAGASEAVETDEAVEAVDKPAPPHALLDDKHKKIYINAGETLVLTVPFTGTPPPEVAWFIGEEPSESNNRSHVDVMKGKTILNVAGTKPTDAGEYRLKLSNDEGEEESLFSVTVLDKPHCPVQPEVTDVKKDNITIAWEKPEHDGGSPITGYIVEKRDTRDNRWETVATNVTETEWTIPQLKEGHSYSFSVSAVNAIGASAPVETAEATKATRQPEPAKLNLDEALLSEGIKVKGGDTIKIEVPFSGCPTPDVKFTKNGEPLGRRAKVTVDEDKAILEIPRADRDDAGSYGVEIKNDLGEDSAEIPVTIIDKPKSPQNLTVPETTVDTVTLAWEPPADDGGSPITGYRIERRDARRQMWTDAGTATECTYTVPGLIEGNRYHFRVSAQSKAGNSEPLETSQPITAKNMFDEPEPPAAPEVSNITPESCIINWKPPEKDAGIPVTGYHLEKRTGYSPRWMKVSREPITDTSYRLDELVEGEEYEFRVAAENRMGTGRFSRPSERIVAKDHKTPAALKLSDQMKEGITVKKGETMNFEVPFDGSPVPEIAWLMNEEPLPDSVVVSNTGTKSIISIDDVSMNDSGEYKIQIVNEHGADEAIIPVKVIDTPTAPNDVRVANITSEDAVVEWDSPDEDGGAEILGFQIEICDEETPDKWKKVASTKAKRVTVTDLKEDHEYKFRVSAENAAGCSKPAETEQPVLAQDKPSAPSLRIGDKYNDGIKVKAGQPVKLDIPFRSNPPAEVTWEFNGQPLEEGGKVKVDTTKNNSSVVVKDSKRADKGEYKITVKNDLGEDSFTVPVEVIDKPAAPKEVRMKDVTAKEATVAWDAPEDDGGAEIRDFIVEICDMDEAPDRWRQVAKNNDGLASLHNLKEDHEYKVRVIAENAMGKGEPKEAEKPFVAQDKPMAPSLHVGNTYDKGLTVKAGQPIKLEIPYKAIPAPEVTWTYNGKPLEEDNRTKVESTKAKSNVTVKKTKRSDKGEYTIKVENELGHDSFTVDVNVIDKPDVPKEVRIVDVNSNEAKVEWDEPEDCGGAEVLGYQVEICDMDDAPDRWKRVTKTKDTCTNLPNLKEDHEYKVRVTAENEMGAGPAKEVGKPFVAQDKPTAPELKVGDKYKDGLTVKAGQPIKLEIPYRAIPAPEVTWLFNGEPIKDHKKTNVESGSKKSIVTVKDSTRADDKGEYTIKIKNDMGEETMSVNVNVIDKPEAPKEVRARDVTSHEAVVEWDEPADDGGVEILDFVVEICDEEEAPGRWKKVAKTKDKSVTVPNLKEDHEYKVRVSAENEVGTGPAKDVTKSFICQDKPCAPELKIGDKYKDGLTVKAGQPIKLEIPYRAIPAPEVTWLFNGKPIKDHKKTNVESGSKKSIVTVKDSTRVDDKGEYTIKIKNDMGEETMSVNVNVIDKPEAPKEVRVQEITSKDAMVEWEEPADKGGVEILDFVVEICDEEEAPGRWKKVGKTKDKSMKVPNLKEDHEYKVRVSAENEMGTGPSKEVTKPFVAQDKPIPPEFKNIDEVKKGITVKAGETIKLEIPYRAIPTPEVTWTARGKPLVEDKRTKVDSNRHRTIMTVKDAIREDKGDFKLKLKNDEGEQSVTIPVNVIDKPKPPQDLKVANITADSVTLTWKKPEDDGGKEITGYIVDKRKKNADEWENVANTKELKTKVSDLVEGNEYNFRLRATNEVGESTPVRLTEHVLIKAPPAPPKIAMPEEYAQGITLNAGQDLKLEIPFTGNPVPEVTWTKDGKPLKPAKNLKIVNKDDETTVTLDVAKRPDKGEYKLKLKNELGEDSASVAITILDKPTKVKDLIVTDVTNKSVLLKWKKPEDDGGTSITAYVVEKKEVNATAWVRITMPKDSKVATETEMKFTVPDLAEDHEYLFRVSAENKIGRSDPLETKEGTITKKPPAPPKIDLPEDMKNGVTFHGGDTLLLEIPFTSYPPPEVTWFKDDKPMKPDKRIKIDVLEDKTVVSIDHEAVREDMGQYKLKVKNDLGEDTVNIPVTVIDVPKKPRNLQILDVQADNVTISWEPPVDDGGTDITGERIIPAIEGYIIEKNNIKEPKVWVKVSATKSLKFTVLNLIEGDEYHFRIFATNKIGPSEPLMTEKPVKCKRPKIPPKIELLNKYKDGVEVCAGEQLELEIPFSANPMPDVVWKKDGKPIKANNRVKMVTEEDKTVLTIPETERGDLGKYAVTLKNELGEDTAEIPVNVVDKPNPPRDLKVTDVREDQMTLSWKAPDDCNGAPLLGYTIEKQDQADGSWQNVGNLPADATNHIVPDLHEGHDYHFRVCALNRIGTSVPLQTKKAIKAERRPAPPDVDLDAKYLEPIVLRGGETLNIVIPYTGNPPPSVEWMFNNQPFKKDRETFMENEHSIAKLTVKEVRRDDMGSYKLRLKNDLGRKDVDIKVTVIDHPLAPRDLKVVNVLADSMVIRWREPEEDGGSPVTGYVIDKALEDKKKWEQVTVVDGATLTCKIPGLVEGTKYHYRVAARNDIGEGPHVVTEKATLASRPPAPPDVDLDAKYLQPIVLRRGDTLNIDIPYSGNPDPTVAWCHDNKPYKEDLRAHMKDDDSVAKLTVEDVRRNDSGTYTLKLKNDLGSKDVDIKVTVIDHPKPPRDLKVTNIMADSMVIRWREPEEDGGSPISAYAVEKCDISDMDNWEEVDVVDHLTVNCKIPNLTEGHEYNFRVRARNDIGDSDPITTDHPIKAERPPAPPDFDLDAKYAGTITLKGGETLDVEIPFSGKPDPTVRWNHNGKPLTMGSDDRLNLDDTDFVARLTVTNVNRNDSGPYVMKLSNELGTKDCHLRVKVIDKPDMPTNLKATNIMPDSITIRWQEPLDDGGAPVTGYLVEKAGVDKDDWEEVGITDSCNMKVPNLTEGQEYHFRVTAKNDIGDSDPLETTKPIKADSPPAAPDCYLDAKYMGVVTIRGGETLYLEVPFSGKPDPEVDWFHKGNPINEDGRTTIDNSEQVARLKVEDARLEDGGLYSLRLMNKLGSKDAQIKVKVIDVPKPPKDLRVTDVREDRMTLRWKEPESDCGCPITGYIVEYSGIDKDDWTVVGECTAMNFTVLHLIEGEEYFFKVRAVNEVGKGEPNETVQPVRAERPPAPPAAYIDNDTVTVEAGDDLVIEVPFDGFPIPEISWIINGHMVTAEDEGVITEITPDNVAVLSIPRVQKDDGGVFQIRLKNDLGRDQKSINVIVLGAPGRPEHLNPTDVTEDSVTLKWQRPRDNGGSPITSYVVEKRTHPDGEWEAVEATDETTFTVRELTEGNEYYFRVFAENKYGLGYPAETEEATLCKCPFEKPEYTLGAEYKKPVYVEKGGTLHLDIAFFGDPEPSASWNFKDLAKGRDHQLFTDHRTNIHQHYHIHPERAGYVATIIRNKMEKKDEGTYWLHLKNLAGEEAIPIEVLVMDVPLPPRDLKVVEVSAESMTVHWKPPEDDGGTELTGYIVEDKDNSRRTWRRVAVVPPEQFSAEIPNLIEGFLYLYRVFAENKMGLSEPCEMHRPVEAANDFIEPGQPSMPEVYDVRPTACELEWDPPSDDGGAPVTEYIVEGKLVTSTRWVKVNKNPVTEPNYSVKGLNEGADYEFRIVAVNKAGLGEPGPPSDIITAKSPYDPPGIPGSPDIISVHGDCVELEWTKPRRDGGKPITNYIIEMRPVMSRTWTKAKTGPIADTFCKVPNLETGGEFVFRVVAENEIGAGKPSQPTKSVLCGDGPQVIQELSDVNIAVGQKLLLKCKINGEPTPEIKWYKDGRELFDGRRFKLKYRDNIAQLMMDKVYDSEAGKYSCSGTNELGTAKTSCHVTVSAKPKKLLKRQNTMTIELDDFVEVDDDDYSRESPIHEEEEEEEELESGRGDVAFIKPVFKKKLSDINCSEGGAVKLTCVVSGVPRPEVVWLRNGQPIQDADDYRYIVDGESNSLIIKEVFPEDVGLYSVRASNVGGSVACDAMLTVDGEDEEDTNAPRFRKLMKDCEVCENESASFTVKMSGRPQPEVSWFVNETMIVPDNRKYTVTDDGDMCTLTVNQCSMRDADNYACKAVNEAGEITCHADLIVNPAGRVRRRDEPEYPPEFLEEIEDETVVEGDEVTFTCSYRGNPDPDLQWFRNGRYLTPTKDLSIRVVGNRCTFIIREAFPEDSGTYTCQITNELGQATTSAMLLVEEEDDVRRPPKMAPSFSERFHDLEIYEGYEATFSCKIVGVPRPDVIWYFNNKKVDTTDPQFRFFQKGFRFQMSIPNASMNQSGEVVCKAKNSEGSDFCSAELIVHEGSGEKGKSAVPQFARKLKDSEVMEGAEGMLDVRVHPDFNLDELKIQWFKNGAEIYPDGHFEMLHDDTGQFSLLIHNATPADRGQYMCEVSNPAGKAACVADIVVDVVDGEVKIRRATGDDDDYGRHRRVKFIEEPPATPNKPEVSNIRDTSCYLSWRALPYRAGENLTYTVEYRDANARNWRLLKQTLTDPWLNVDILKPEFDYMFRIRAENMFGVSDPSPHASVRRSPSDLAHRKGDIPSYDRDIDYGWDVPPKPYVEGPPMFRGPDENMYVAEHQEAQLGMFVYGWPRPEVEWFFNGQPLQMGDKHKMHWESATSRQVLTVNDVLLEDIGTYMIVASNEYGKCARNIVVELAEPPCFIEPLKDKSIIERWGGRMDCRVDGIPYPEIKWFKDWHPISNSERIEITEVPPDNHGLTIRHAIMRDEGMYTCVAKNIAGEVHTHCSLTVEPEPLDYLGLDIELANKKVAPKKHKCNDFYDTVGDLGCGDFSEVKKVVERTSGREFAAKFYDTPDENKENAKHEIEVLGHLHHGNIPTLHDAFESQNAVVMVQELCDGGNVFDRLADKPSYTENEVALYLKQLLDAVKYMHSKHYMHLDLKPENLMFHHADSPELKLIDFGNARQLKPGEKVEVDRFNPEFVAPEILTGRNIGTGADMWSIGTIAYAMLTGLSPFLGDCDRDTINNVKHADWDFDPQAFRDVSDKAKDFINRLLVDAPELRMTAKDAAEHPFIRGLKSPDRGEKLDAEQLRNFQNRRKDLADKTCVRVEPGHWDLDQKLSENAGYMLKHFPWSTAYTHGPDTTLVQLKDPQYTSRLRGYLEDTMWSWRWHSKGLYSEKARPSVHERRRILDIQDEAEDDRGVSTRVQISNLAMRRRLHGEGHAPVFREKLHDTSFRANVAVTLKCVVVGNPLPNVSWYRNDERLSMGGQDLDINLTIDGVATLLMPHPTQFAAGVYKVVARNSFGESTCWARLRLGETPDMPSRPQVVQIAPNEAFLEWDAPKFDGNSDIQTYRVDYRKPREERWTMASDTVEEEFTVVTGLIPNTPYRFRSCAKNQFGYGPYSFSSIEMRTPMPGEPKLKIERSKAHLIKEAMHRKSLSGMTTVAYDTEFTPVPLQEADPENNYVFRENIFVGRFCAVHKCIDSRDQTHRAAKIFPYTAGTRAIVLREFEAMRRLSHGNVVRLHEAFLTDDYAVLVLDKLEGGELLKCLCWHDEYTEELVAKIVRQLLDALQYLQYHGIVHLDLQPDNIMMVSRRLHTIKLADFGSARTLREPTLGDEDIDSDCPLEFMAPEVANYEAVSLQADVWGVGVLAFIMLSGVSPFLGEDDRETMDNISFVRYDYRDFYRNVTQEAFRFVQQLLRRNPMKRLTVEECLEHRWMQVTDVMTRQRESTSFFTNKLRIFAQEYNLCRKESATRNYDLLHAFGSLTRASSVDSVMSGFD